MRLKEHILSRFSKKETPEQVHNDNVTFISKPEVQDVPDDLTTRLLYMADYSSKEASMYSQMELPILIHVHAGLASDALRTWLEFTQIWCKCMFEFGPLRPMMETSVSEDNSEIDIIMILNRYALDCIVTTAKYDSEGHNSIVRSLSDILDGLPKNGKPGTVRYTYDETARDAAKLAFMVGTGADPIKRITDIALPSPTEITDNDGTGNLNTILKMLKRMTVNGETMFINEKRVDKDAYIFNVSYNCKRLPEVVKDHINRYAARLYDDAIISTETIELPKQGDPMDLFFGEDGHFLGTIEELQD